MASAPLRNPKQTALSGLKRRRCNSHNDSRAPVDAHRRSYNIWSALKTLGPQAMTQDRHTLLSAAIVRFDEKSAKQGSYMLSGKKLRRHDRSVDHLRSAIDDHRELCRSIAALRRPDGLGTWKSAAARARGDQDRYHAPTHDWRIG